jgi:hypothetical protein
VSRITDFVTSARAQGLIASSKPPTEAVNPADSTSVNSEAAIRSLSSNELRSDVEKHLSDIRKRRGNLSRSTAFKIGDADDANAKILENSNPRALLSYGSYSSFMGYEARARFVTNVYNSIKSIGPLVQTRRNRV